MELIFDWGGSARDSKRRGNVVCGVGQVDPVTVPVFFSGFCGG
jgi:hypothetical protein